ncbi:MAG: LPXTG cell wall anchor domain-containing protein [Acidimicrobiales bacterium]
MLRKVLALSALLLGVLAVAGPLAPASAGGGASDYANCVVTVNPSTFAPGDAVTVNGTGFQPDFETTLELSNGDSWTLGTVTTDSSGEFESVVTIPADATEGDAIISAVCDAQGNIQTTDVTVSSGAQVPPPGDGGTDGPLPTTGSDPEPLLVMAAVALLAGTAFVLVSKRRRTTTSV